MTALNKIAIHPAVALLFICVDLMLFASDITGVGWFVSCMVAAFMVVPCILLQRSFGDQWFPAIGKAFAVAILTAIPTPLPSFVTGIAGLVGTYRHPTTNNKS